MPPHEPIITLSIQETGQASQPVFFYHVRVDEEVIASNQQLSAAASQTIRDVSRQYNQLFEQRDAPHLAAFYTQLLSDLVGDSRALITCRYRPADAPTLPAAVQEEALGDFPEGDFLKFLLRDPVVERRYYAGELPQELLSELHRLLGGTPRFLEQMRQVLNTIAAADLRQALTAVHLPAEAEPTVLAEMRDRYCEQIFAPRLYSHLPTESQRALSRAAVYDVSVNLEALAAVTGEATDKLRQLTREWQAYALAYPRV